MGTTETSARLCAGSRKDGSVCRGNAWANGYCRAHQDQAPDESEASASGAEAVSVGTGEFRGRFSADVAQDYELLRTAIKSALSAKKDVAVSCPHCKKSSRHELTDHRAAIDAARFAVEQGFGKAPQERKEASDIERLANLNARWGAHVYTATPAERSEAWDRLLEARPWMRGLGRLTAMEIGALLMVELQQWAAEQRDGKNRPSFVEILEAVTGALPPIRDDASEAAKSKRAQLDELAAHHEEVLADLQQFEALTRIKELALCGHAGYTDESFPASQLRPHQRAAA